jgi:hypothetical protein
MRFVFGLIITQLVYSTHVGIRGPLRDVTNRDSQSDPIPIPHKSEPIPIPNSNPKGETPGYDGRAPAKLHGYIGGAELVGSLISKIRSAKDKGQVLEMYKEAVEELESAQSEEEKHLHAETYQYMSESYITPGDLEEVVRRYNGYHDQINQAARAKFQTIS